MHSSSLFVPDPSQFAPLLQLCHEFVHLSVTLLWRVLSHVLTPLGALSTHCLSGKKLLHHVHTVPTIKGQTLVSDPRPKKPIQQHKTQGAVNF